MTEPGVPDFWAEQQSAVAIARTDGFMNWLDITLEERRILTDEDLAYGTVVPPDDHPEYAKGITGLAELVLDYADRNYLSFAKKENSFSNNNAYVARQDHLYCVGTMSGQGTVFSIKKASFEDVTDEQSIITFADILADTPTEKGQRFNEALDGLGDVVAKLVTQGVPWRAIQMTIQAQKPRR